jgi:hypothetical protein
MTTIPTRIDVLQLVSLLMKPHNAPAALPSLPAVTNDWNTFGVDEPRSVIVAVPDVNGSIIAGLNPGIAGPSGRGTFRLIINQGGSNTQNTGNLIIQQDTPGNTWPFHLAGRRQSLVIPSLGMGGFILDDTDKWFLCFVAGVEDMIRSIVVTVPAASTLNSWLPVDATTGLPFYYCNNIRADFGAGCTLNSMDMRQAPAGGSSYGYRFSIQNLGSGVTIASTAGSPGAGQPDFRTPDNAAFIIPTRGQSWFWYDDTNNVIWCDTAKIGGQ